MSEFDFLKQLGIDTENVAVLPSGGESFGASTFIGPWNAFVGFSFMTTEDYILFNDGNDDPAPVPDLRVQRGDYYTHYYREYPQAQDAYEKLTDGEYKPQGVWVFWTDVAKLVLDDEARQRVTDGFGETMTWDVRTLAPRKGSSSYKMVNRHQFTMIALPSAVASAAEAFGIEHGQFSVDELCLEGVEFTDEQFAEAFGELDGAYEESIWWGKRAELWASLGEPNARKQAVKGSLTATGRANSLATDSDKLSACLMLAQGGWSRPIWCAMTLVPDPLPSAVTSSGRRLSIPTITKVFSGEPDAVAYAKLLNEGVAPTHPKLPANWSSAGVDELVKYLKEQDKPVTPPQWAEFVKAHYMDSVELAQEWINYIS